MLMVPEVVEWILLTAVELVLGTVSTGYCLERVVELSSSACHSPSIVVDVVE